ncbi:GNAT family N-acetyltransferase [Nakamurella endophytica]|uniref:UPF0256 protein n=1 Tax=Nakamurella endophytica TaxID=1748367 RepID=A0A917T661_9ACTN|nr:GNAT family N-acetyltransferase [Nakamurella endophytica]GGM10676.1 UPF0256 protein [Nakamurella endophytica]
MAVDVRTLRDEDIPAWSAAALTGFHNPAGDVDAETRRPWTILERTWAGFDEDRIVSTLRSFPVGLRMPGGGDVPTSAVTAVTTSGTHRRRGYATAMMTADLRAARDRGELAAALLAAEWPIYGRFGFGAATQVQTWTVQSQGAQLRHRAPGTVEFVDRATARALVPAVYEAQRSRRCGDLSRDDRLWDLELDVVRLPSWPAARPAFHVVARDPAGCPVGVLRYRVEEAEEYRRSTSQLTADVFVTADPSADALLWGFLLDLDLVATVSVGNRPVDEALPWLLTDARRARPSDRVDLLWVRPLDTAAFLSARRYDVEDVLVLELADPVGLADGRFRLDAGPDGAACAPTDQEPDLTLSLSALSSVSLGGFPLRQLADARLVDEHRAGAVTRADRLFRTAVAPYCSTWF